MNKFFVLCLLALVSLLSTEAFASDQSIRDCRHGTDPVNTGRFNADQKARKVESTFIVPAGTVWQTNSGSGRWVECRTTENRTVVVLKDGKRYDQGCGNDVVLRDSPPSRPPTTQGCTNCGPTTVELPTATVDIEDPEPVIQVRERKVIVVVRDVVEYRHEPAVVRQPCCTPHTNVVFTPVQQNPCCQPGGVYQQPPQSQPQSWPAPQDGGWQQPTQQQVFQPTQQPSQGMSVANAGGELRCTASVNGVPAADWGVMTRQRCDQVKEQWARQQGFHRSGG